MTENQTREIMKVKQIIKGLPIHSLDHIASKLNSDYKIKKLTSKTIFMTTLYSMFYEKKSSLRKLKDNFENKTFQKKIIGKEKITSINHTSFHYRLKTINFKFFKIIYEALIKKSKLLKNGNGKYEVLRVDSTLVDISSKLVKNIGFNQSGNQVKSKKIKLSVGYSELPEIIKIYETEKHKSENVALKETILSEKIPKNQIILFDRGISNRNTYDKISENNFFISRLTQSYKIKIETEKEVNEEKENIIITKELVGKLYSGKEGKESKESYRIIHGKIKKREWDKKKETSLRQKMKRKKNEEKTKEEVKKEKEEEEIIFVTNIGEELLSREEIGLIYKKRWEIEVLFKFLKQELHLSHLINNSENGIKVMVYMTLIFSILLLTYKEKNKLSGYKQVKHKMLLELQEEFFKFVILESGGSIKKWENSTSTFW